MWMSAFGSDLLQRGADAVEIASDGDVVGRDLLAFAIEEEDVGLADRGADDIGALGGADDGVGDLRIGDKHVLDLARQVDHHRLADAERQKPHRALDDGSVAGAQVARGRALRHQRQGGDDRERRGADRLGPQRSLRYSPRSCLPSPKSLLACRHRRRDDRTAPRSPCRHGDRRSTAGARSHRRGCAARATAFRSAARAQASRPAPASAPASRSCRQRPSGRPSPRPSDRSREPECCPG